MVENTIMIDDNGPEPVGLPTNVLDYEELLADVSEHADYPELPEDAAAGLCYTSATTGDPKGVLYSHRSTFLHAMAGCMVDGARDERTRGCSSRCSDVSRQRMGPPIFVHYGRANRCFRARNVSVNRLPNYWNQNA